MFNSQLKKDGIRAFEGAVKKYDIEVESLKENSERLYKTKMKGVKVIENSLELINSIANKSKSMDIIVEEILIIISNFKEELKKIEIEAKKVEVKAGGMAAAGVGTGIGVAALAPSAAMAIATTFGTASTGVAISTLSGAAASNAALAWLGGGALAAGGGGMAGGSALLALAGPIGLAIGGAALAGSGIFASSKNKKIATEAYEKASIIKDETLKFSIINTKILNLNKKIETLGISIINQYNKVFYLKNKDFNGLTSDEIFELGNLVNNTKSMAMLVKSTID